MFDLNKLKQINDYQGHAIGNRVIIELVAMNLW